MSASERPLGSAVGGVAAGATLGGVFGATINGRRYYRDPIVTTSTNIGQPQYSDDMRC
jgi:hypothetical protein